jgi:hypothetical protein
MKVVQDLTRAQTQKWALFWRRGLIIFLCGWAISFTAGLILTGTEEDVAMWFMIGCTFTAMFSYWKMRGHEIKLEQMDEEESK